jgi:hypothetical protein
MGFSGNRFSRSFVSYIVFYKSLTIYQPTIPYQYKCRRQVCKIDVMGTDESINQSINQSTNQSINQCKKQHIQDKTSKHTNKI